jgi:hypothetical protein
MSYIIEKMLFFSCILLFFQNVTFGNLNFSLKIQPYDIVEVILIDPQGKRLGYDKETKNIIDEISPQQLLTSYEGPSGYYGEGNSVFPKQYKLLELFSPVKGLYTLKVIGVSSGLYSLEMLISIHNIHEKPKREYKYGIIKKGEEHLYEIYLASSSSEECIIKKRVNIELIERELINGYKFKLIKNKKILNTLLKQIRETQQNIKRNKIEFVIKNLQQFIEILNEEKLRLIREKNVDPIYAISPIYPPNWQLYKEIFLPIDILINDAETLLREFKK